MIKKKKKKVICVFGLSFLANTLNIPLGIDLHDLNIIKLFLKLVKRVGSKICENFQNDPMNPLTSQFGSNDSHHQFPFPKFWTIWNVTKITLAIWEKYTINSIILIIIWKRRHQLTLWNLTLEMSCQSKFYQMSWNFWIGDRLFCK